MADDDDENESTKGSPSKTFTQADVDRIAAKEKDEGKRAGINGLLKALGFNDEKDLKKYVEEKAEADQARLTEIDKREQAADKKLKEAEAKLAEAQELSTEYRKRGALMDLGMDWKATAMVARLVDAKHDTSDEDLVKAVGSVKESMPQLFSTGEQPDKKEGDKTPPPRVPGSNPSSPPPKEKPQSTADAAKERLRLRHPNAFKKE